jgi:hypothetical protein
MAHRYHCRSEPLSSDGGSFRAQCQPNPLWIAGAVAVLGIIGAVSGGGEETPAAADHATEKVAEKAKPAPATEPEPDEAEPAETPGQENARRTAEEYLDYTAFSRTEPIKQLEYEGYSTKDATYAVDAISPD